MNSATKRALVRTLIATACVAPVMPVMTLVTGHVFKFDAIVRIGALTVAGLILLFFVLLRRYDLEERLRKLEERRS